MLQRNSIFKANQDTILVKLQRSNIFTFKFINMSPRLGFIFDIQKIAINISSRWDFDLNSKKTSVLLLF